MNTSNHPPRDDDDDDSGRTEFEKEAQKDEDEFLERNGITDKDAYYRGENEE